MRSLKLLLLFSLFLLGGIDGSLRAFQNAQVEELLFLPPEFYVGDRVELRVVFRPERGMRVTEPSEIPVQTWLDIHDLELSQEGGSWVLRLEFTPFAVGTRTLPSIQLGDVRFSDVKLHTQSVLAQENTDFVGIKGQIFLPGTRMLIGLGVAVVLFGPMLILLLTGRLKNYVHLLMIRRAGRRPYKRLLKVFKELEDQHLHLSNRRFYILLSDEFRRYLTIRTGLDFISITSSEIYDQLRNFFPRERSGSLKELNEAMLQSDMIKFGGRNANKEQRIADLSTLRGAAEILEEHLEELRSQEESRKKFGKKTKRLRRGRMAN